MVQPAWGRADDPAAWRRACASLFGGLPFPIAVLDGAGRVVAWNGAAARLWGVGAAEALGRSAPELLRIVAPDPEDAAGLHAALEASAPLVALVRDEAGRDHRVPIWTGRVVRAGLPYTILVVPDQQAVAGVAGFAAWAAVDPTTGIAGRSRWAQEERTWRRAHGVLLFFDLDGLKEINDLYGHAEGDRALAAVGAALRASCPAGAVPLRFGGDEFLVVWPGGDLSGAEALAAAVADRLGEVEAPAPLRLSHGAAAFGPGGLDQALASADEAVYERKGALWRAASGARIVFTREARTAVRGAGEGGGETGLDGPSDPSAACDDFRAREARSLAQARGFVRFARVPAGGAVVVLHAAEGLLAFDGGLAASVGCGGQLLLCDPSDRLLQRACARAVGGFSAQVRCLRCGASALPLASATVDLVLGTFLDSGGLSRVIREMARVARPGGAVAVDVGLCPAWPPAWWDAFATAWAAVGARDPLVPAAALATPQPEALATWCRRVGLVVEEVVSAPVETRLWRDVEDALHFARRCAVADRLASLAGAPEPRALADILETLLRQKLSRDPEALRLPLGGLWVRARRAAAPGS
jgi:diguanylate cyclase (GGDEF)-like protein